MRRLILTAALLAACSGGSSSSGRAPATGTYEFTWTYFSNGAEHSDTVRVTITAATDAQITGSVSGTHVSGTTLGDGSWQLSAYRCTSQTTLSAQAIWRSTFDGTCTGNLLDSGFNATFFDSCTERKIG